ncbi:CxxH/CxxC protein [Bacillus solimangrovi]|uniref:CxxH/CxxC protein n=1 Tax=Bacillus solimangrovi TaxID=1305675 RepID=A0A1E5LG82_9BACI|nr:CxxH/CxxC protein [Bacillus solimangrovi]OEH93083.1 CxxH/CxxC protein [Bacillus solimangrovi]
MIYCCKQHVDLALDDVVDLEQTAPLLEEISEDILGNEKCKYCENQALYQVEASKLSE